MGVFCYCSDALQLIVVGQKWAALHLGEAGEYLTEAIGSSFKVHASISLSPP